jgi:hypothetical protein
LGGLVRVELQRHLETLKLRFDETFKDDLQLLMRLDSGVALAEQKK